MSTAIHDNQCDAGERCEMCAEVGAIHESKACACDMCRWADQQEREQPTIPTFANDWERAPATTRRLTMREDAEWFWLKGQQAGRIAEQVETRRWLARVMAGYDERVSR